MPEHLHYDDDAIYNPETHHEKSDVNVRALLWSVAIFVVFGFVTHFMLFGLYKLFVQLERGNTGKPLTSMARPVDAGPPEPRLQPFPKKVGETELAPNRNTPVTDLDDLRRQEHQAQTTYGWIDKQRGAVRIPIAKAKELALQRSAFPVVATAPPPVTDTTGTTAPPVDAATPAPTTAPTTATGTQH